MDVIKISVVDNTRLPERLVLIVPRLATQKEVRITLRQEIVTCLGFCSCGTEALPSAEIIEKKLRPWSSSHPFGTLDEILLLFFNPDISKTNRVAVVLQIDWTGFRPFRDGSRSGCFW